MGEAALWSADTPWGKSIENWPPPAEALFPIAVVSAGELRVETDRSGARASTERCGAARGKESSRGTEKAAGLSHCEAELEFVETPVYPRSAVFAGPAPKPDGPSFLKFMLDAGGNVARRGKRLSARRQTPQTPSRIEIASSDSKSRLHRSHSKGLVIGWQLFPTRRFAHPPKVRRDDPVGGLIHP